MNNRLLGLLIIGLLLSLVPAAVFAGVTGKIIGIVVDSETKEALPGANVMIDGTNLGAATNVQGGYIMLNVPPGTYTLKTSFIGYREVSVSNVRVHADLTTELNFNLPTEAIEVESIAITATRPLVNKNATNSTRIKTSEEIELLPVRGFRNVISLESGVTNVGGRIYVRGGRREEIATYIDGVYQNNPTTGRASGDVSSNAIEEVNFQTGGFNAEYGFANSGVIQTITKSGGNNYSLSGELITDGFLSQKDKNLGTYSYGYNVYNMSFGGPVPGILNNKVKFYISAERRFNADANPSSFAYNRLIMDDHGNPLDASGNPITFADTSVSAQYGWNTEDAFPGTDGSYKRYQWDEQGVWPDNSASQWLWNGNVTFDFSPVVVRIGGNSQRVDQRMLAGYSPGADYKNTTSGAGIGFSLWNSDNNPKEQDWRDSYYLKVTHTLNPSTFYTAQVNYFRDKLVRSSVLLVILSGILEMPLVSMLDSMARMVMAFTILTLLSREQDLQPIQDQPTCFHPLVLNQACTGNRTGSFFGVKADLTKAIGRTHEIKGGLEYRYNDYRSFAIGGYGAADLTSLSQTLASVGQDFSAEQAYQVKFADSFGYDIFGNETDTGRNSAKNPVIAAFYLQDKIELEDLVLNIGLRYDYFDPAYDGIADVEKVTTETLENGVVDLKEENFVKNDAWTNISPRLGFSFPVTDRTVFHAQYGKFVQTPELNRLYVSTFSYAFNLASGNFFRNENPNLGPVRTTAYEVGFRQQMGDNAALDLTAYYKEIRDHVRLVNLNFATPVPYAIYQNQDYGTVKGLSASFTLRRTNRITANVNYTLQWAAGTGSDALTFDNIAWQQGVEPTYVAPLDYDQRHTGSANVDFRTLKDDGPTLFGVKPLGNVGANLLLTFGSGLAYTPVRAQTEVLGGTAGYFPIGQVGSSYGPWNYQLDLKVDKSFKIAGIGMNAYAWILNVTDAFNAVFVYPETGEADNDGYFNTEAGKNFTNTWGQNGVDLYNFLLKNPNMAGTPRQIRLGLRFDL